LVDVLHQLSETYPAFRRELDSLLRILFRDFARISFPSNKQGELYIRWEDTTGRALSTSQISDGTLKFLCLIAILKNPSPPALIGLDEPDAKLHPMMQVILDGMIDEAAQRTQIIATTHNPHFVSSFTPEEIVILQQYHGETEMRRFSSKGALELWLQDFTTRELWLMGELESRW
jgi:predicted ATPase